VDKVQGYILPFDAFHILGISNFDVVRDKFVIFLLRSDEGVM